MAIGCTLVILMAVAAIGYGHWLTSDRIEWNGPAECAVTLSGYERNRHALEWLSSGRIRSIWIVRAGNDPFVEFGIEEHPVDTSLREFRAAGVLDSQVRVIEVDVDETNVPAILRAIGDTAATQAIDEVIVMCDTLEPRFLRQVADAALPLEQANRLRFVPLPHNQYQASQWWRSRTGWKDLYVITLEVLGNLCFGATSGFDRPNWNPDDWEAQTFPPTGRSIP